MVMVLLQKVVCRCRRYPSLCIATASHVQFLSISMALFALAQDVRVELKW